MTETDRTCWTVIKGAAAGRARESQEFARRYGAIVRAYLGARWKETRRRDDVEDAVQEVFLECFRSGGALERLDRDRAGGFRAFFYGVVRNVAWRIEKGKADDRKAREREDADLGAVAGRDTSLSRVFDRAWAKSLTCT